MKAPITLDDWAVYVASLPEEDLFAKARAANTMKFFEMLRSSGHDVMAVKKILVMFVSRMSSSEIAPPGGGVYDLRGMLDEPELLSRIKLPEPDPNFTEPDDDVDMFVTEVPA